MVAAESRECLNIVQDFKECLEEASAEEYLGGVPVELMDPCVAKIFSKTQRAQVYRLMLSVLLYSTLCHLCPCW